ncbi:MAG TPA: flagellar brake protein [Ruminiclostridium sp.]
MDAKSIRIGTKLEIEIPSTSRTNDFTSSYVSQLIDVIDHKTICVVAPMIEGRLKYLSNGSNIAIYFLNDKQDLLNFSAVVKGYRKIGPLETFDITITGDITKIQRRRFYRLDVALSSQYIVKDAQLLISNKHEFSKTDEADLKTAYTKNISGSGLCLVLDQPLEAGSTLDITINLDDTALIKVSAQVIRSITAPNKKYEVGMHYVKITPRDLEILTKFIFQKQRLILKNTMQAKIR